MSEEDEAFYFPELEKFLEASDDELLNSLLGINGEKTSPLEDFEITNFLNLNEKDTDYFPSIEVSPPSPASPLTFQHDHSYSSQSEPRPRTDSTSSESVGYETSPSESFGSENSPISIESISNDAMDLEIPTESPDIIPSDAITIDQAVPITNYVIATALDISQLLYDDPTAILVEPVGPPEAKRQKFVYSVSNDDDIDIETGELQLTAEERRLIEKEGIQIPTNMPLTKDEQKELRRIRRKIRNKQSAMDSRQKKKVYITGLEDRVKLCTAENNKLKRKVNELEEKNSTLLNQLRQLQAYIAGNTTKSAQTTTCAFMLLLSLGLVVLPSLRPGTLGSTNLGLAPNQGNNAAETPMPGRSRTLLWADTNDPAETLDKMVHMAQSDRPDPWSSLQATTKTDQIYEDSNGSYSDITAPKAADKITPKSCIGDCSNQRIQIFEPAQQPAMRAESTGINEPAPKVIVYDKDKGIPNMAQEHSIIVALPLAR